MLLALPTPEALATAGWRTAAVSLLMAIWWATEAVPLAATALVPLAAFPLLGIAPPTALAGAYGDPLIFLFLGGFLLALAIQRAGLHRRLALAVTAAAGTGPRALIGGFMLATAFLSMEVSNTATAATFLPIATALAPVLGVEVWLLAMPVAVAASCAFMMPVATPPNAIVYASGHLRIADLVRAGLLLNLVAIVVISAIAVLTAGS